MAARTALRHRRALWDGVLVQLASRCPLPRGELGSEGPSHLEVTALRSPTAERIGEHFTTAHAPPH